MSRRGFVGLGAATALSFLASPWEALGQDAPPARGERRAVIVLWLGGGASQLETFDPKPGTKAAGRTRALKTAVPGVELAEFYPRLAAELGDVALIRSVVTPEGEHERGTYLLRTGYRPVPTVVHPSLGAIASKELADPALDVPAHFAVNPGFGPPRGGLLGAAHDAVATGDPRNPITHDVLPRVPVERLDARLADLEAVDGEFARGRGTRVEETGHGALAKRVRAVMTSPRLAAFDLTKEPRALVESYGDSPFGRGCLLARRLVQVGVVAVEVSLGGWDSHSSNFETHARLGAQLDAGFSALLRDLRDRDLLRTTLVVCMGEFGRTPTINRLEGRDHWSRGFSVALAGRGIRGGAVVGETDPAGEKPPTDPVGPGDLFATLYVALGLDPTARNYSPAGRPVALAEGKAVARVLIPG